MSIQEKLTKIAEDTPKVYEAGVEAGKALGGYEEGRQAEYDAFWDDFQQNGLREDYERSFCGQGWTDKTFTPKYDMVPIGFCAQMFHGSKIVDLKACLEKSGVTLDMSKSHYFGQFAQASWIQRMPVIDASYPNNATGINMEYAFGYSAVVSFEKIIFSEWTTFANTFIRCTSLVDLPVEGVIAQNGFSVADSPNLSEASIRSIIAALSTTTTGLTVTLSESAVHRRWPPPSMVATQQWEALVATRPNWTIALA